MTDGVRRRPAGATRATWPHRRYDPLLDRWVLVSVGRTRRPWHGTRETQPCAPSRPAYDPKCYLCPGNVRANGERNPDYPATFVFTNDFAALQPDRPGRRPRGRALRWRASGAPAGWCASRPATTWAWRAWSRATCAASSTCGRTRPRSWASDYRWVQVFENRGAEMGASSPHPHGQIWAGSALPTDAAREDATPARVRRTDIAARLLLDYAAQELGGPRVVEAGRRLAGRGALLGGLAVRDAHPAAGARDPASPTSMEPSRTRWPRC